MNLLKIEPLFLPLFYLTTKYNYKLISIDAKLLETYLYLLLKLDLNKIQKSANQNDFLGKKIKANKKYIYYII